MATEPFDPANWLERWWQAGGTALQDHDGRVWMGADLDFAERTNPIWAEIANWPLKRAAVRALFDVGA
jgi:hypothetical protein